MADECKILDPTAFGLFVVAMVSLPLALWGFLNFLDIDNDIASCVGMILTIGGAFILIASLLAYRAGSNFGFIVFGLVAAGVLFSGLTPGETYIEITLGVLYLICLVWSYRAKTLKLLTLILLTTALIYFAVACLHSVDGWLGDGGWLFLGIAAILNFILTLYLAFALADEHLKCF